MGTTRVTSSMLLDCCRVLCYWIVLAAHRAVLLLVFFLGQALQQNRDRFGQRQAARDARNALRLAAPSESQT